VVLASLGPVRTAMRGSQGFVEERQSGVCEPSSSAPQMQTGLTSGTPQTDCRELALCLLESGAPLRAQPVHLLREPAAELAG
jgi:hypothetical protein